MIDERVSVSELRSNHHPIAVLRLLGLDIVDRDLPEGCMSAPQREADTRAEVIRQRDDLLAHSDPDNPPSTPSLRGGSLGFILRA